MFVAGADDTALVIRLADCTGVGAHRQCHCRLLSVSHDTRFPLHAMKAFEQSCHEHCHMRPVALHNAPAMGGGPPRAPDAHSTALDTNDFYGFDVGLALARHTVVAAAGDRVFVCWVCGVALAWRLFPGWCFVDVLKMHAHGVAPCCKQCCRTLCRDSADDAAVEARCQLMEDVLRRTRARGSPPA